MTARPSARLGLGHGGRASNASGGIDAAAAAHRTTASDAAMTAESARSVHTDDGEGALEIARDHHDGPGPGHGQGRSALVGDAEAEVDAEAEPEFTVDADGVQSNELEVLQLGEGAFFGERALLSNGESSSPAC